MVKNLISMFWLSYCGLILILDSGRFLIFDDFYSCSSGAAANNEATNAPAIIAGQHRHVGEIGRQYRHVE